MSRKVVYEIRRASIVTGKSKRLASSYGDGRTSLLYQRQLRPPMSDAGDTSHHDQRPAAKRRRIAVGENEDDTAESAEPSPRNETEDSEPSVSRATAANTLANGVAPPLETSHHPPAPAIQFDTAAPLPETWDVSFFGIEPIDEFTAHVADWLYDNCRGRQHVEIEAKIGTLVGMGQGNMERLSFPVVTETILQEPSSTRFESTMTLNQHKHYNRILNERIESQKSSEYRGPRLRYEHLREIDRFFAMPGGNRLRVTTDAVTGQLKPGGIIVKKRVADLNVFSPKRAFDFRISVNIEEPAAMPTSSPNMTRSKDRVSYQYDMFKIDLTQVTDPPKEANKAKELRHELEIEFLRPDVLVYEGELYANNDPNNHFHHMVQVFLNNIHLLIRNANAGPA